MAVYFWKEKNVKSPYWSRMRSLIVFAVVYFCIKTIQLFARNQYCQLELTDKSENVFSANSKSSDMKNSE